MSAKQALGALLIALPFIALAILCFKLGGWQCFAFTFGLTAAVGVIVSLGVYLLTEEAADGDK